MKLKVDREQSDKKNEQKEDNCTEEVMKDCGCWDSSPDQNLAPNMSSAMSSAVYELDSLTEDQNVELNKALEDITCVVQVEMKSMDKKHPYQMIFAGFCIHPSGLIMTCAHPLLRCVTKDIKILAFMPATHEL
ncbi:hypothetical protein POM88_038477 [Heracleum sosnowskyi]|uniref:Uncharacterized protein n=1 Tax=Heracleum sosnowskyi TaxID=360622 RepID=A0AAD8H9N3_9APIA|nr:hypothetical protein POM88_038477 [Heracleum sosnowskyi]